MTLREADCNPALALLLRVKWGKPLAEQCIFVARPLSDIACCRRAVLSTLPRPSQLSLSGFAYRLPAAGAAAAVELTR